MSFTQRVVFAVLLCPLIGVFLVGCDLASTTASVDVTGSWNYSNSAGELSTWALIQSDSSISGAGTDGETISGSVSGDSIYLTLTYSSRSYTVSLSGTVSGSTMSGSFTDSSSNSGSWTAVETN